VAATVLVMAGATCAHTWAGGHLPSGPGLLALGGLVLAASHLVLRGSVRPVVLLPAVALAQAGLHTAFAAGAGEHAAHAAATGQGIWTWQMLAAHTAVTLLTALVWQVCARAAHQVVTVLALALTYAGGRRDRGLALSDLGVLLARLDLATAPGRGPPQAPSRA
jgi:hypothetical protein